MPPHGLELNDQPIEIRMPARMADRIKELSLLHSRTRSGEIRHAVQCYIDECDALHGRRSSGHWELRDRGAA